MDQSLEMLFLQEYEGSEDGDGLQDMIDRYAKYMNFKEGYKCFFSIFYVELFYACSQVSFSATLGTLTSTSCPTAS